jgi:hypothetical protein
MTLVARAASVVRLQLHANPSHHMNEPRMISGLPELAPQPRQMHINRFRCGKERLSPHLRQEFLLRHHLSRSAHQIVQQLKLFTRQRYRFTIAQHGAGTRVESQTSRGKVTGRITARPTKYGADAGIELFGAERFAEVVIGAFIERAHDFTLVGSRRRNDDWGVTGGAEHSQHHETVYIGKAKIEDDHIGSLPDRKVEPGHGGTGGMYDMTNGRERVRPSVTDRLVVLNDDDDSHEYGIMTQIWGVTAAVFDGRQRSSDSPV